MSRLQSAKFLEWAASTLAVFFGVGYSPVAPGTTGSAAAIGLVLLAQQLSWQGKLLFILTLVALALWASHRYVLSRNVQDPPEVVIDEVAGMCLAAFFLPESWLALVLSFIFFRFFDILKPFPVRHLERLSGGCGIVVDDLMAGVYAYFAVMLVWHLT
jgi:phosphatidylglycerophosphatase A